MSVILGSDWPLVGVFYKMKRAGKLTVLTCAIFLTIATFRQTNIFKNDLTTQLDSDETEAVIFSKEGNKYKYLNEFNGKN